MRQKYVRSSDISFPQQKSRFGIPGTARASLALYNGHADLDALVAAIHKAQALFGTRRSAGRRP